MKLPIIVMLVASLTLVSCGGGGSSPPIIVTQILSDPAFDGDIAQDILTAGTYTVTQGNTQLLFAGIDPATSVDVRSSTSRWAARAVFRSTPSSLRRHSISSSTTSVLCR